MNSIRPDTGIPEGLRISIGGNVEIVNELGGSMTIEYETFRLREGEAFIVFIDSEQVMKVDCGKELDNVGLSPKKNDSMKFDLTPGDHLIQFSLQSTREKNPIASFWDTQGNSQMAQDDHIEQSLAEVAIKRITFRGANKGGAYECKQCPVGTISTGDAYHC